MQSTCLLKNLNSFKKNIKNLENKNLIKKLINSKKVRKQIINLKQDIAKPDFGRVRLNSKDFFTSKFAVFNKSNSFLVSITNTFFFWSIRMNQFI